MRGARDGVSGLQRARRQSLGGIVKFPMVKTRTSGPVDKHVGSRVRMRRMMLGMSQTKLGDALGITFQQVQKYENGKNRIGASRLQHISNILQVPVPFFFESVPHLTGQPEGIRDMPSRDYVVDFLATIDGLALTKAFMEIKEPSLRRRIVALVEEIAGDDLS
jgi:transcriptional regulator with XRE-family HTH domain